jgi:uncharacterized protein (TIGR04255 family)
MAAEKHLPRAPIQEAVIDFRLQTPDTFSIEDVAARVKSLAASKRGLALEETFSFEGAIKLPVKAGTQAQDFKTKASLEAFGLRDEERGFLHRYRRNGLSVHKLGQYSDWKELQDEAHDALATYCGWAAPTLLLRLSTRFINVISIPGARVDLDDWITDGPRCPPGGPSTVREFKHRTVLQDEPNCYAILNVGTLPSIEGHNVRLTLDIDVVLSGEIDISEPVIDPGFAKLRRMKNALFFGSLTDRTLELFE